MKEDSSNGKKGRLLINSLDTIIKQRRKEEDYQIDLLWSYFIESTSTDRDDGDGENEDEGSSDTVENILRFSDVSE